MTILAAAEIDLGSLLKDFGSFAVAGAVAWWFLRRSDMRELQAIARYERDLAEEKANHKSCLERLENLHQRVLHLEETKEK